MGRLENLQLLLASLERDGMPPAEAVRQVVRWLNNPATEARLPQTPGAPHVWQTLSMFCWRNAISLSAILAEEERQAAE